MLKEFFQLSLALIMIQFNIVFTWMLEDQSLIIPEGLIGDIRFPKNRYYE